MIIISEIRSIPLEEVIEITNRLQIGGVKAVNPVKRDS